MYLGTEITTVFFKRSIITIKLAVDTHGDSSGKSNSRKSRRKCSLLPRNTIKENFYSRGCPRKAKCVPTAADERSEEHTSELQSRGHLVCRLLLEKKKL